MQAGGDDGHDYDEGGDFGNEDGFSFREVEIREQDRFLPVANIARIMKKVLPTNAKIAKDAKEGIQECVSEFISFITSEASDKCQQEKRKTINGDDLLWAMSTLGFDKYVEPLKIYLAKYRESVKGEKPEKKPTIRQKEPPPFPGMHAQPKTPSSMSMMGMVGGDALAEFGSYHHPFNGMSSHNVMMDHPTMYMGGAGGAAGGGPMSMMHGPSSGAGGGMGMGLVMPMSMGMGGVGSGGASAGGDSHDPSHGAYGGAAGAGGGGGGGGGSQVQFELPDVPGSRGGHFR